MGKQLKRNKKITELFNKQQGDCFYCKEQMTMDLGHTNTATVDHIVPLSKGGLKDTFNEVAACFSCNNLKGNKPAVDFVFKQL